MFHYLLIMISLLFTGIIGAVMYLPFTLFNIVFGFIIFYSCFRIALRYLNGDWTV